MIFNQGFASCQGQAHDDAEETPATPEQIEEAQKLEEEFRLSPRRMIECGLTWDEFCDLHDRQLALAGGDTNAPKRHEIVEELERAVASRASGKRPASPLASHGEDDSPEPPPTRPRRPWEPLPEDNVSSTRTDAPAAGPGASGVPLRDSTPPPKDDPGPTPPRPPTSSFTVRELETIRRNADRELAERTGRENLPLIVDAASFTATPIPEPPEVVRGVLHRGSKAVYGGPSKAFKSWTLLDLCLAVSTGGDWLGFETTQGPVLYLNFELQPFAVCHRLRAVAKDRGCGIPKALHLWNLRGFGRPLPELLPELLRQIEGEQYALIVPDPIYKTLGGRDESSAGDIGEACSELDRLAVQTEAAIAFGAHFAKGNASGKDHMDRVSGSGVWARDPDAILTATPHEQDGAFTLEMTLRNFAPVDPVVLRWDFPRMRRDLALDPQRLKQAKRGDGKAAPAPVDSFVDQAIAMFQYGPLKIPVFRAKLEPLAGNRERGRTLYNLLLASERLEELRARGKNRHDAWIGTPEQIAELRQGHLTGI